MYRLTFCRRLLIIVQLFVLMINQAANHKSHFQKEGFTIFFPMVLISGHWAPFPPECGEKSLFPCAVETFLSLRQIRVKRESGRYNQLPDLIGERNQSFLCWIENLLSLSSWYQASKPTSNPHFYTLSCIFMWPPMVDSGYKHILTQLHLCHCLKLWIPDFRKPNKSASDLFI